MAAPNNETAIVPWRPRSEILDLDRLSAAPPTPLDPIAADTGPAIIVVPFTFDRQATYPRSYSPTYGCPVPRPHIGFRDAYELMEASSTENKTCAICLLSRKETPGQPWSRHKRCGKNFHTTCGEQWHERGRGCALCRQF